MPRRKRAGRRRGGRKRGGRRYKRTGRGGGTAGLGPANLYPYGVAAMV